MSLLVIGLVVGLVAGIAITYLLLEQRLSQQGQKQKHTLTEELERSHQSRLQATVESLQAEHEKRLQATIQQQELEMQTVVESLQEEHQNHLIRVSEEIQQKRDAELQGVLDDIHQDYQSQLEEITQELRHTEQSKLQEEVAALQGQYESRIQELTEQLQQLYAAQGKTYTEPDPIVIPDLTIPAPIKKEVEESTSDPVTAPVTITLPTFCSDQQSKEQIVLWGQSKSLSHVAKLMGTVYDPDPEIRGLTATALGQIAAANGLRTEIKQIIPILGKLSQDIKPTVRKSAVASLALIPSDQVIPFLERALRDSDHQVVQVANQGIRKFNFYPTRKTPQSKPISTPKHQKR